MPRAYRLKTKGPTQTQKVAGRVLRQLLSKSRRPIVLALSGDLGSGKTTFIQGLVWTLGIREKIQSPTFVLVKRYQLPKQFHRLQQFKHFIHIDAYRIERPAEARHLGLKEIFKEPGAIIAVEWAERVRKLVPRGAVWIRFKHGKKSHERRLQISKS